MNINNNILHFLKWNFVIYWSAIMTRELGRGENDVKDSMCVYAAKLICSTGVSGFQIFKLVFCIYNKLHYFTS